jgi:hypothetical protein
MWNMEDLFSSPQSRERDALRLLTPHAQDALMNSIRVSLPEEGRPKTFDDALASGTLDTPTLMLLLQRIKDAVPQPQQPAGGMSAGLLAQR